MNETRMYLVEVNGWKVKNRYTKIVNVSKCTDDKSMAKMFVKEAREHYELYKYDEVNVYLMGKGDFKQHKINYSEEEQNVKNK